MQEARTVALAGAGVIAQQHLRALRHLNVQLIGICDISEQRAAQTAKEWGIQNSFNDFSKMLEATHPFMVSILTPPQSHAELATHALKMGINVLIEKPLTLSTQDARMILDALKQSNARMNVVYHHLFSPTGRETLRIVRAGELGQVLCASVSFLHGPKDDPMGSNPNHWSHSLPGGRITEMLPHPVYLLQPFLGNELAVDSVHAEKRGERPWMLCDELQAMLHSKTGIGNIYVSFNAAREGTTLELYGTKGVLKVDLTNQTSIKLGQRGRGKLSSVRDTLTESSQLMFATAKNTSHFLRSSHGEHAFSYAYRALIEDKVDSPQLIQPLTAYKTVEIVENISQRIHVAPA
jgi:predicted dehydrogenase